MPLAWWWKAAELRVNRRPACEEEEVEEKGDGKEEKQSKGKADDEVAGHTAPIIGPAP